MDVATTFGFGFALVILLLIFIRALLAVGDRSRRLVHALDLIIVPLGATENHGPHGPNGEDIFLVTRMAEAIAEAWLAVLVAVISVHGMLSLVG